MVDSASELAANPSRDQTSRLAAETLKRMADNMLRSDPLADPIYEILWGLRKFKILNQAVELGLFDDVDDLGESATIAELSRKWPDNSRVLQRLLDALVGLKLLHKTNDNIMAVYKNSPSVQKYLIRSRRPSMVYSVILESIASAMLDDFPMVLQSGTSEQKVFDMMNGVTTDMNECEINDQKKSLNDDSENYLCKMATDGFTSPVTCPISGAFDLSGLGEVGYRGGTSDQTVVDAMYGVTVDTTDCETEVRKDSQNVDSKNYHSSPVAKHSLSPVALFMLAMEGHTGPTVAPIARAFDLSGHKKVVDLGGGSGLVAYELSRTYLRMHVTVFDIPQVVQLEKDLQEEDTKDRVTFVAGDFFKDPLPPADLYILSRVLHDWDTEKGDVLLRKVFDSLPSGGHLMILEQIVNEDHTGPEEAVLMDMVMAVISNGREQSASEYRQWLEEHDFRNTLIKRIDGPNLHDLILTQKPF